MYGLPDQVEVDEEHDTNGLSDYRAPLQNVAFFYQ